MLAIIEFTKTNVKLHQSADKHTMSIMRESLVCPCRPLQPSHPLKLDPNTRWHILIQTKQFIVLNLARNLFLIVLGLLIVGNVEVTELEGLLVSSNNTEPITDLVLLQELLGEVLEVTLRESNVGNNGDLVVGRTRDSDSLTEVVGTTINLDTVMKVLFL